MTLESLRIINKTCASLWEWVIAVELEASKTKSDNFSHKTKNKSIKKRKSPKKFSQSSKKPKKMSIGLNLSEKLWKTEKFSKKLVKSDNVPDI